LATYETDKVPVPPDIDCGYGRALANAIGKSDKLELAARVLHRCLLAVPPGSRLRQDALTALTALDAAGLDPKQIAKPALADLYLTRAPSKPTTDGLSVVVSADPITAVKTFPLVVERLTAADVRGSLIRCWDQQQKSGQLVARLPFKVTYKPSEYEDEPGTYKIAMDAPAGLDLGSACVLAVAAPVVTAIKGLKDKIDTTLVVTIK
jgi:hypothetical protein